MTDWHCTMVWQYEELLAANTVKWSTQQVIEKAILASFCFYDQHRFWLMAERRIFGHPWWAFAEIICTEKNTIYIYTYIVALSNYKCKI